MVLGYLGTYKPNQIKPFEPLRSFTDEEYTIRPAVSEILLYKHTDVHTIVYNTKVSISGKLYICRSRNVFKIFLI